MTLSWVVVAKAERLRPSDLFKKKKEVCLVQILQLGFYDYTTLFSKGLTWCYGITEKQEGTKRVKERTHKSGTWHFNKPVLVSNRFSGERPHAHLLGSTQFPGPERTVLFPSGGRGFVT